MTSELIEASSDQKESKPTPILFNFRDRVSAITLKDDTSKRIAISPSIWHRLKKHKAIHNSTSFNHTINILMEENALNRQLLRKLKHSIERAIKEQNVNYFIKMFTDNATNLEKAYYDAIMAGLLG